MRWLGQGILQVSVAIIVLLIIIQPVFAQLESFSQTRTRLRSVGTAMPYITTPYFTFFDPIGKSGIILAEMNMTALSHDYTNRFALAFPPNTKPLSTETEAPVLTLAQCVDENAYYVDTYTFSDVLGTFL